MRNVVVIGVGALGSHFVQFIRTIQNISITVVDFDRIEAKNLLSQFHAKPGVSKNKAFALAQNMSFTFGVKIASCPYKLIDQNAETFVPRTTALAVDCLDNAESRILLQNHCRKYKIPLLHGALATNGQYGRVVWDEKFKIDSEAGIGAATCENGEHLPFIAVVSAYLALAAQKFLTSGEAIGFEIAPVRAIST